MGVHGVGGGAAGRTAGAAVEVVAAAGEADFEVLPLRLVHKRRATGFEDSQEMPLAPGDVIAGRYQVACLPWAASGSPPPRASPPRGPASLQLLEVCGTNGFGSRPTG